MLSIKTIKADYLSLDEHYLKKLFCDDVMLLFISSYVTPWVHVKASGGGEEKWQYQKCHAPSNPSLKRLEPHEGPRHPLMPPVYALHHIYILYRSPL